MLSKELITTIQASKLLGFSRTHIIRMIKDGLIEGKMIDGQYYINKNSIGVLKDITPKETLLVQSSTGIALKRYGDVIKKLGAE